MIKINVASDLREVYEYQKKICFPYAFSTSYDDWKISMNDDIDGQGRRLFKEIKTVVAYVNDVIVGFIQYGNTAFGFDETGEISDAISYPIIRMLYYDKDKECIGEALIQEALKNLEKSSRVYAFFHYFGMSCYARHGKLFEKFSYIEELLKKYNFVIEHENVYYSSELENIAGEEEVELKWGEKTKGNQQMCEFVYEGNIIGECEIHYVMEKEVAYLRWIYIYDNVQNKGLGSKCMTALKLALQKQGFIKFDTDTAVNNMIARHYYEKNGFVGEGITRSFMTN